MAKLFHAKGLRRRIGRSPAMQHLLWRLEAAVLALFWWFCARLSPAQASARGRALLRRLGPHLQPNRHFLRNLVIAFPDRNEAELSALAREVWGNTGAVLAEYPHLERLCRQVELAGENNLRTHRPAVFVTAHLANWEISAGAIAGAGIPLTVVYTPLTNPWVDRMLKRHRRALGCTLLSRDEGMRPMLRRLGKGESVGLVIDQRVDSGALIPFFGIPKPTTLIPARLALRLGCDLIPARVERLAGARFRVAFHEPVEPDDPAADEQTRALQMMAKVNGLFEAWIRERPSEWMCSKRRWPKDAVKSMGRG